MRYKPFLISLCLCIIFSQQCFAMTTEHCHFDEGYEKSEPILWEYLIKYAPNEYIAAGALGMFYRESRYGSDAVAGWGYLPYEEGRKLCKDFTQYIDDGLMDGSSKQYLCENIRWRYGGYGLGQWLSFIDDLFDFAQEWEVSIADAEMQCAFIFDNIQKRVPKLWDQLLEVKSAREAGQLIGIFYDGTACFEDIGEFAQLIYDRNT